MHDFLARRGLDIGIPLAIVALGTVEVMGLRPPGMFTAIGLQWLTCGLLMFRRRWPLVACTLAGLVAAMQPYAGPELSELSTPILMYGLAIFALGRHTASLVGMIPLALLMGVLMADMGLTKEGANITDLVFAAVLVVPPYVFGRVMRLLADRNELLSRHAALLAAQQESLQREAVAAERARMAREVHDVIAHSVSVMTVQAAAAEASLRERPEAAVTALREVQSAGRGALAETGRLLRLLRDHDDELGLAPEPGIDNLDALVSEFRRGGLEVDLTVAGQLDDLPKGLAVSAYRVVREILTNALKHATDRRVVLSVVRRPERLDVSAENLAATSGFPAGGGLGLVGMAERIAVHGGRLDHRREADRFCLVAQLPIAAASS